jgi:hypothetical protein
MSSIIYIFFGGFFYVFYKINKSREITAYPMDTFSA